MAARSIQLQIRGLASLTLAKIKTPPAQEISESADDGTTVLTLIVRPKQATEMVGEAVPPMFFSALELSIVQAVGSKKTKQAAIARRCGQTDSSSAANTFIRDVLRNLVDRGILSHDDEGYQLTDQALLFARSHRLLHDD